MTFEQLKKMYDDEIEQHSRLVERLNHAFETANTDEFQRLEEACTLQVGRVEMMSELYVLAREESLKLIPTA